MMERMSFWEMWAKLDTKQKIYRVFGFVFFLLSFFWAMTEAEMTVFLCGNLVLQWRDIIYISLLIVFGIWTLWQYYKYVQMRNSLRSSMKLCADSQKEQEYERALEELDDFIMFFKKSNFSYLYCYFMALPLLFYALLLYINLLPNDGGGQVQKSVVLSIEKHEDTKDRYRRHKGSLHPIMRFPIVVDGKRIEFKMDQFDSKIKKGMKLLVTVSPGKLGWPVVSRVYVDTIGVGWLKDHRYDYIENEQKKAEWKVKQENAMQKTAERNVPQQMAERNVPQQTFRSIDELIVHRLPNFAGWREAKLPLDRERPCPVKLLASKDSQEDKYCNLRLERRMLMVRDTVERVFLTTCHFPCRSPYSEKDKAAVMNLFNGPGDGIVVVNPILLVEMWESKKITVLFDGDEYRTYAVARCTANPNYLQIINSRAFLFRMKKAYSAVILFSADKNHTNWRFGTPR